MHSGAAHNSVAMHSGAAHNSFAMHSGAAHNSVTMHSGAAHNSVAMHSGAAHNSVAMHSGAAHNSVAMLSGAPRSQLGGRHTGEDVQCEFRSLCSQFSWRTNISLTSDFLFHFYQCSESGSTGSTCFGPPGSGSGSISQRYGSGSGSVPFCHHAKIVRKTLIPTILLLFLTFYLWKIMLPSKSNKQKKCLNKNCFLLASWRSMTKKAGSGSRIRIQDPDPESGSRIRIRIQ